MLPSLRQAPHLIMQSSGGLLHELMGLFDTLEHVGVDVHTTYTLLHYFLAFQAWLNPKACLEGCKR